MANVYSLPACSENCHVLLMLLFYFASFANLPLTRGWFFLAANAVLSRGWSVSAATPAACMRQTIKAEGCH